MHPHVSFEPYPSYNKPHPYHQQPLSVQQKGPLSPVPAYNTRNNYHYKYSPSHHVGQKSMNSSVQEPFYKREEKVEYQRPQSNKDKRENGGGNLRNEAGFSNQVVSRPISNGQTTSFMGKFSLMLFPNTSKMLNLQKFVQQNVKLRNKLLNQLQKIKQKKVNPKLKTIISQQQQKTKTSTRDTTPKRVSKDKASTLFDKRQKPQTTLLNNSSLPQTLTQEQQLAYLLQAKSQKMHQLQTQKHHLQQLQKSTTLKRQQLHKFQSQQMSQSIHETPLLRQKQLAIECLSVEIQWMNEKSVQIRRLINGKSEKNGEFEMYERMCREVESLRKENNRKSERLKKLFEKTNQLTSKEENVNMFLMNLKV